MQTGLQSKCDRLLENWAALQSASPFEYQAMRLAAASLYLAAGKTVDAERLKACKKLLRKKKGVFSNFRGIAELLVRCKMALADDAEAWLERLDGVYGALRNAFSGEQVLLAAMVITDLTEPGQESAAAARTKDIYAQMREAHPWLTSQEDMPFAALMAVTGKDSSSVYEEAEKVYESLKEDFPASAESRQMLSHLLALYPGHAEVKCARLRSLAVGLKKAKHPLGRHRYIAVLGSLAGAKPPVEALVGMIGETDDYLRQFKPFKGAFGVSGNMRRMIAVQLVESELSESGQGAFADAAVSPVVSTSIEVTIITLMLMYAVIAATSASSSSH